MATRRPARESRDRSGSGPGPKSGPKPKRAPQSGQRKAPLADSATASRPPSALPAVPSEPQRLNKYLASHGLGSRRRCDELILEGHVWIDGKPCTELGTKIDPETQRIEIEGVVLKPAGLRPRYYLLNKPSGVVCTNDDHEARPRAIDLIADPEKGRIFTVGRLDEETTGLLILTNDGDFAHRVMHPSFGVTKTYLVKLRGRMEDRDVQEVREGVFLAEGRTAGARVIVLQRSIHQTRLEVTLQEGKNREVRRVFANLGHKVVELKRTRLAQLTDRGLKVGKWRPLTRAEVAGVLEAADPEKRAELEAAGKLPKGPQRRGLRTDRAKHHAGPAQRGSSGRGARSGSTGGGASRRAQPGRRQAEVSDVNARPLSHPLARGRAVADDDDLDFETGKPRAPSRSAGGRGTSAPSSPGRPARASKSTGRGASGGKPQGSKSSSSGAKPGRRAAASFGPDERRAGAKTERRSGAERPAGRGSKSKGAKRSDSRPKRR